MLQINIQRDDGLSYDIVGEGVNEEPWGLLSFNKTTGDININGAVDYEEKKKIKVSGGWGLCCGVKVKDVLSSPVCLLCNKNDLRTQNSERFMWTAVGTLLIPCPSLQL